MKVAFVVTNKSEFNITHYNNQEIGRAKAFVDKGYDVDILVYSRKKRKEALVYSVGETKLRIIYYYGVRFLGNQTIPINLFRLLKKVNYELIFVHEYPWIIPAMVAKLFKDIPGRVFLMQGMYEDFNSRFKRVYNKIFDIIYGKRLIKNLDGLIFKTEGAQNYFKDKGYLSIKNTVIPVGLDTSKFKSGKVQSINSAITNKVLSHKKRLLYIGTIEQRRNPMFLIDLLGELVKNDNDILLIVVGKGPMEQGLLSAIKNKQLNNNFLHVKSLMQEELPWLYKNSDILLLPSSYEIFGMILLEGLFFKLPIISTPTAGSIEVLKGNEGMYIEELDIIKWSSIINKLTRNVQARLSIDFPEKYKWEKIVGQIIIFCGE